MPSQTRKAAGAPSRGKPRSPRGRAPEKPAAEKPRARLSRTPAERTGPIRDATMMFRSAPLSGGAAEGEPQRRHEGPSTKAEDGTLKGAVEHSVEMAYRVIDDLLQRGRRAAGRASNPSTKANPVRNNQSNNIATLMMQTWMDMGRMWFGMMGPMMFGGLSPWQQGTGFGGMYGRADEGGRQYASSATQTDGRTKVTLDLRSDRPTEVMIDLNRHSASSRKLSVQPLRVNGEDPHKPAIAGVDIVQHQDGAIRLSVSVPSGQPHGTYTGTIVTDEGHGVGAVTVKIHQIHGHAEPAA